MRLLVGLSIVAFVLLAGAPASQANPLADPPRLQPLLTEEELLSILAGEVSPKFADALAQAARLGPGGSWLLEELAQRDDLSMMLGTVFRGLADNGDPESLSVLRSVLADTTRSSHVRCQAAKAIADARDHGAIPLLNALAPQARRQGLGDSVDRALRRLESPGHYRKLIALADGLVRFGFLLGDIESISYSEITTSVEHTFAQEDLREICDLLQTGSEVELGMMRDLGKLTFTLRSGARATLHTDGEHFGGLGGGDVECRPLVSFIWARLGRVDVWGEPAN